MKTINYQLSSQKCLEEGWTIRPPSPLMDDTPGEIFEPEPILPPWAESEAKVRYTNMHTAHRKIFVTSSGLYIDMQKNMMLYIVIL